MSSAEVRQAFLDQLPQSSPHTTIIDAAQREQAVTEDVIRAVDRVLNSQISR